MAESSGENQHNVDDVVNTLDAFHISEDHDSSNKGGNQENVFQRTDRYRDWKNKREQENAKSSDGQPTSTCSAQLTLEERRERRKQIRESWLTEGQRSSSNKSESQSNGSIDKYASNSSLSSSNSDLQNSSTASVSSVDSHIEAMRQRRKQMMQGLVSPDSDSKSKLNSSLDSSKPTQRRWISRTTSNDSSESKPNIPLSVPTALGSGTQRVALTRSSSLDRRHLVSPLRQRREGSVDRLVKTENGGNVNKDEQWTQDDSNMGSAMKNILKSGLLMSSQTILAQRRLLDKNSKTIQSIQASHRPSQNVKDDKNDSNQDVESSDKHQEDQVESPQKSLENGDQDTPKSLSDVKPSFRLGRTRLTLEKKSPEHIDQNGVKSDSTSPSAVEKTSDDLYEQEGVTCIFRSEKDMENETMTTSDTSSNSPVKVQSKLDKSHDGKHSEHNSPVKHVQSKESHSHGSVFGPVPFSSERSRHGSGHHHVEKSHSNDEIESQQSPCVHVPPTSKSTDLSNKSELNQSSIKRIGGVTDLDKAMQESDQQKLKSIFKNSNNQDSEKANEERSQQQESHHFSVMETDLDSPTSSLPKIHTSAKTFQKPMSVDIGATEDNVNKPRREISSKQTEITKPAGEKRPKDLMYKPNVNLEDAVKSPMEVPVKLDFRHMECFEGQMLLQWLNNAIDDNHYLRLLLTRHDLQVVISQVCTCLMAAGVIKQLESKDIADNKFKTDCMYYWAHTENPVTKQNVDIGKLAPMWPPAQPCDQDIQPGQKYTEAEHQTEMVRLRKEYQEEVDKLKTEHQSFLDRMREEYQNKIQECIERIIQLHNDVEKYKQLAGIEELTQAALSDAEAAGKEAGIIGRLGLNLTNGFLTPEMGERFLALTGTPSTPDSVYHTPAMTPECSSGEYPSMIIGENEELGPMPPPPDELRPTPKKADVPAAPAPPPPPPPPPGMGGPPPPPPPLPGGGPLARKGSLKPVINPKSPMKALFWQRIQVHEIKSPKNKEYANAKLVWESLVEPQVDSSEIENLFSKQPLDTGRKSIFDRPKSKAQQFAKVIEPKRSQAVGILLSSLKMDFSEIENAILTFDTSQLGEDKLRSIYENRGEEDEIKKIKKQLKSHPDVPLDKPEQFLYELHQIPDYGERIFCFIFQQSFQESMSVIDNKITNIKMTAETLVKGRSLRYILGLILAVGNYMNGGNRTRGQADGFGLEILPKLKDVKSKDNRTSLLNFIVTQYVKKREREHAGTEHAKLPVPDPSDISQATSVNFDEIEKELKRIKRDFDVLFLYLSQLTAAEKRAEKVINNAGPDYLQPFKDIMTEFFTRGRQEYKEQEENLVEGKKRFEELVIYFCVKPKQGDKTVTPEYFFSLWSAFCGDFKDLWKKEQQRVIKQRIKDAQDRVRQLQERKANPLPKKPRRPGGLMFQIIAI
ncbi:hypothetical protein KUTeg_014186 [Tegillarca granosa]|uniref:FH2 domain-containing protein n=1 Tax=Tegillarca granosa TaxID=220873 RepID=A0ABQ9F0A5_TEGGR|nr:hypothetical protein KUTeg_014186 [Tegillarca granosa]